MIRPHIHGEPIVPHFVPAERQCRRCGILFEAHAPNQVNCPHCAAEVAEMRRRRRK